MKRSAQLVTCLVVCSLMFLMLPVQMQAQPDRSGDDGLLQALEEFFQRDYMSIGVLLQSQGEFHWDPDVQGQNSFRIPTARLRVQGQLDNGFGYKMQADVSRSPSLLDASISYAFSEKVTVASGAMKPGISAEYLTSAASTDFINRSRVVSTLVGNRDVGILVNANPGEGLTVSGGIFNGNRQNLGNNDNNFYLTGRVAGTIELEAGGSLDIGINAGHSREDGTVIGNGTLPAVNGDRTIYGGDLRLETGPFMVSSEVLMADLEYFPGFTDRVNGFHLTGGYQATDEMQLVLRYDHIESDIRNFAPDLILGGMNYNFTDAASFQLNYQVNPDRPAFANHRVLAQMQIAF